MTRRARIRKLMRKHQIERVVYCGPIQILGSKEWNKNWIDCDFYFENDSEVVTSTEFRQCELKTDLRKIEKFCYYIFDFNRGEIKC